MLNFEYPVYQVKTPQTLLDLRIQSMTLSDESKLRASLVDDKNLLEILNKTLYNKIENKDVFNNSYEEFLNTITLKDREAVIAGLYHVSYGGEYITTDVCPSCGYKNESKINVDNIGSLIPYEGQSKEILEKEFDFATPITKTKFVIKVPTIGLEMKYFSQLQSMDIVLGYLTFLHTSHVAFNDSKTGKEVVINRDENVYDFIAYISSLPVRDIKAVNKFIRDTIDKYSLVLQYKVKCANPKCGNEFVNTLNFVDQLFRMVFEP